MFDAFVSSFRRIIMRFIAELDFYSFLHWLSVAIILCLAGCTTSESSRSLAEPSGEKTPIQELKTFHIEPGLKIQLVASEPMVQDPVVITFDPDGRLWVVEMRGFMPTIDGTGERERVGRISVLEDSNGDGQMDVSTIYLDSLILPRAIALVPGGALIVENESLWLTQDLDNNLKADTKILIDPEYAGNKLPEHAGNGLWRSIDNWYYNVKSRFRYRLVAGTWQRDSTEFRGQWGISHDDAGRLFYNYNWSQLHADLVPPNYLSRNKNHIPTTGIDHGLTIDRRIYPIRPNPAVNRGYIPGTLDAEGRLLEFTAACSPLVYRGDVLPKEYRGNVFVCEPSGNLIKRNVIESSGLQLAARDPHPGKEFLASTDERFRPVHLATGPDGGLYIADMYRGLIQHGAYVTPYLREQTLSRNLSQPIHRGRIWRIVPENWNPQKQEKLSELSSEVLVAILSHADGWHRDMAQRLLVERKDTAIKKFLWEVVQKGKNNLGRIHALWTLEGLKTLNPDTLLQLLKDENTGVSTTAMRLLEPYAESDKKIRIQLGEKLLALSHQASIEQSLQIALTAEALDQKESHQVLKIIVSRFDTSALIRDATLSSIQNQEFAFFQNILASTDWQDQTPAKEIFLEMLSTSIVRKKNPTELKSLVARLDKKEFGWHENAILNGMSLQISTGKAVRLSASPGIMKRTDLDIPATRLQALASLFEWPGSVYAKGTLQKENLLNEKEQKDFALGRQYYLNTCSGCHGADGAGLNRFAPPLKGSEWVLGDERRLTLILLHGIEGALEVAGEVYDKPEILPVMPGHSTLDDAYIASIITYIRNEWGNQAGAVSRRIVGTTRHTTQGRVVPWTAGELNKHILETKVSD